MDLPSHQPTDEQVAYVGAKVTKLNNQLEIGMPICDTSIAWNAHCMNVYLLFQKQILPNPMEIARMTNEQKRDFRAEWENVLAAQLFFTPYHFKVVLNKMTQILKAYETRFGEIAETIPEGMQ